MKVDLSENTPGWKFNEWELRGVPVRMEIGPRDVQNNSVMLVRRDNRAKESVAIDALETTLASIVGRSTAGACSASESIPGTKYTLYRKL